jgi:hypothetical protein
MPMLASPGGTNLGDFGSAVAALRGSRRLECRGGGRPCSCADGLAIGLAPGGMLAVPAEPAVKNYPAAPVLTPRRGVIGYFWSGSGGASASGSTRPRGLDPGQYLYTGGPGLGASRARGRSCFGSKSAAESAGSASGRRESEGQDTMRCGEVARRQEPLLILPSVPALDDQQRYDDQQHQGAVAHPPARPITIHDGFSPLVDPRPLPDFVDGTRRRIGNLGTGSLPARCRLRSQLAAPCDPRRAHHPSRRPATGLTSARALACRNGPSSFLSEMRPAPAIGGAFRFEEKEKPPRRPLLPRGGRAGDSAPDWFGCIVGACDQRKMAGPCCPPNSASPEP